MTARTPQLESIELVSEGWINKYILHYRMPDGSSYEYESVSRKKMEAYERSLRDAVKSSDALSIVGITPEREVLLIREFRYPLNSWCIAFPAGLMEPGESYAECAERELREETGYRLVEKEGASSVRTLPQAGCSSTGLTDEAVQVCFCDVEPDGAPRPERAELIETFTVPLDGLREFLDSNELPIGTRCQLVLEAFALANPKLDRDVRP